MWTYNYTNELYHHGILGQKWGKRNGPPYPLTLSKHSVGEQKARWQKSLKSGSKRFVDNRIRKEKEYRNKLSAISKSKNVSVSDKKRVDYRNQSIAKRLGAVAISSALPILMNDVYSGKVSLSTYTNKKELTKRLAIIGGLTFANFTLNESLAKSTSSKYSDEGKRLTKERIIEKEDWINMGVSAATSLVQIIGCMGYAASWASAFRDRNQQRVDRWGANILPQKVDNIVWQSLDKSMVIIDNRM